MARRTNTALLGLTTSLVLTLAACGSGSFGAGAPGASTQNAASHPTPTAPSSTRGSAHRSTGRSAGASSSGTTPGATTSTTYPGETPQLPSPKANLAAVLPNGQHLSFSPDIEQDHMPANGCSLLSPSSATALFGGPVTATPESDGCTWTQQGTSVGTGYSLLGLIGQMGSDSGPNYQIAANVAAKDNPTPVPGIGQQAIIYGFISPDTQPAMEVLGPNVYLHFEWSVPPSSTATPAQSQAEVEAAARAITAEFS